MPIGPVERHHDAITVSFSGVGDGCDIARVHADTARLQAERPARFLVADTTEVTDYEMDVRTPSLAFLEEMKRRQWFELVIVIAPSSSVRMMASALGMASSVRLRCVADRAAAAALIGAPGVSDARDAPSTSPS